jgi:hypothetical protein
MKHYTKFFLGFILILNLYGCGGPSELLQLHVDLYLDQPISDDANQQLSKTLLDLIEPYQCDDKGYRIMLRVIRIDLPDKSNVDTIEVYRGKEDSIRMDNFTGFDAYTYSNLEVGYLESPEKLKMGTLLTTRSPKVTNIVGPSLDTTKTRLFLSKAKNIDGLEVDSIRGIIESEYCTNGRMRKLSLVLLSNQEPPGHDTITIEIPEVGDTVNVGGIAGIYVKKMGSVHTGGNHPVDVVILDPLPNQYYLVTNTYSESGTAENNSSLGLRQLISKGFVNARILRVGSTFKTILVSSSSLEAIRQERDAYKSKFSDIQIESVNGGRVQTHY